MILSCSNHFPGNIRHDSASLTSYFTLWLHVRRQVARSRSLAHSRVDATNSLLTDTTYTNTFLFPLQYLLFSYHYNITSDRDDPLPGSTTHPT